MDHVDNTLAQWHQERPELDVAPMGLIGRLVRVTSYLSREMEKTFAEHGLTDSRFDVLATLRRSGTACQRARIYTLQSHPPSPSLRGLK